MCWPFTDVHSPWQPTPLRGVQAFHVKQKTPRLAVVLSTLTSTSLKRNPLVILLQWPGVVFKLKSIFTQKALLPQRGLSSGNNWKQARNDVAAPWLAPHSFFQHTCFCYCKWGGSQEPSVYAVYFVNCSSLMLMPIIIRMLQLFPFMLFRQYEDTQRSSRRWIEIIFLFLLIIVFQKLSLQNTVTSWLYSLAH